MADMTNEQVLALIREKMSEKNAVIQEQQAQIDELESQLAALRERLAKAEQASSMRESLIEDIAKALD